MQPLGYLCDESEDIPGQVLIKTHFHASNHITQLQLINDWILQLMVLKKHIMRESGELDPEEE